MKKLLFATFCFIFLFLFSCENNEVHPLENGKEKERYNVENEVSIRLAAEAIIKMRRDIFRPYNNSLFLMNYSELICLDSVLYYRDFTSDKKAEYAEFEKKRSVARMKVKMYYYYKHIDYNAEKEEEYRKYVDSLKFYTSKLDSLSLLTSKKPIFVGFVESHEFDAIKINAPQDTTLVVMTFYLTPDFDICANRKKLVFKYAGNY